MPAITALKRQRQEDDKFEGTMEYRERLCLKNDVDKTGFNSQVHFLRPPEWTGFDSQVHFLRPPECQN